MSSYPVTALILDEPPLSCEALHTWPGLAKRFPLPLPEFLFEPSFPILVVLKPDRQGATTRNWLVKAGVDYLEADDASGVSGSGSNKIARAALAWLEELGI